ncbi:UTP--glucose-1-phosphate uridylyltransferase [Loktanella sp. M215]|uniref:UTP--glucose-1-phosphate uridylyltransferase n=1 Tax=Loktanella sp. M215 TaxID=2675431 RepID=UPI001F4767DF
MTQLHTVVFPVAGRGTRLLPITKSVPKELLPVYDKPVLQFAVEEALDAGAKRLIFVTHASKTAIPNYLKPDNALKAALDGGGKTELLRALDDVSLDNTVEVIFVEQDSPLGLGHAVLLSAPHVTGSAFGVILPDDVILGTPCLTEMAAGYPGGHMIAAMKVSADDVSKYGIFDAVADGDQHQIFRANGLVEKPDSETAPSQLAAVGRYILDICVFDALRTLAPGAGGEYQLTDAIAADVGRVELNGFAFSGSRYDCGNHAGLLQAANARAAQVGQALVAE